MTLLHLWQGVVTWIRKVTSSAGWKYSKGSCDYQWIGKEKNCHWKKSRIAALFDAGYNKTDIVRLTGIKQSIVYSLFKWYKNEVIWKISEDRVGEQSLQIGTLASSVSSHLKFPFVSLQDKVSEKSHLYTVALQVNNKTCFSYYRKLQYFFQNSLFSFDEAKMDWLIIFVYL